MAELWAEGQAMTSEQVIAYALEEEPFTKPDQDAVRGQG